MKKLALIVLSAWSVTAGPIGCHFFDDFDKLPEDCPLNSGYPCPCDPTHEGYMNTEGLCDDGSVCAYYDQGGERQGFCSNTCFGLSDETSCSNTDGYGVTGFCWLSLESSEPNACVVVCEFDGQREDCPPGLKCLPTVDGFSACFPPTADESGDSNGGGGDNDPSCECSADDIQCSGSGEDIMSCDDGCNWTAYSCYDVCAGSGGYSGSCGYDSTSGHDVCWCNSVPSQGLGAAI